MRSVINSCLRHAALLTAITLAMPASLLHSAATATVVRFAAPWTSPYQVDPARPFHLVNGEGRHLFILNKTAWAYFACKNPAGVLSRARAQGVNVIRVALEGTPYLAELGLDLWPWGGTREQPDWSCFNEPYWREVECRIRLAGDAGIGLDVVLYFTLTPGAQDRAAQRAYWAQALTRIGRYANVLTWEIANEYTDNLPFQRAAGAFFRANDPHGRPVCTSAGTTDDAVWPDEPWMSLAINHTCTSSHDQHDLATWYLALARNTRSHGKPAWCNESGREGRHHNDDPVHRRKQGWLWCAAGCFWTWHAWDGCEGIDATNYLAPGAMFMQPMADYFRALPFWTLAPNQTALTFPAHDLVSATLADAARACVVAYVCTRRNGAAMTNAVAALRLPHGAYHAAFHAPCDGTFLHATELTAPGLGATLMLPLPTFRDDLAICVTRTKAARNLPVPGTQ